MREQGQHKKNTPPQKLKTTAHSSMSVGRGIFRIPRCKGGLILLAIVIVASYYQSAISDLFANKPPAETPVIPHESVISPNSEASEFTTTIMATLEETWQSLFQARGLQYQSPKMMIYRDSVNSACNDTSLAVGTFYCPQDHTVYISLTLYDDMKKSLGAGGDFTQGYVIAHAVGHHVQQLLEQDGRIPARLVTADALLPEQELQADCLAGLWGHRMAEQQILSAGDLQQALNVDQAIEQQQEQRHTGVVMPETFAYSTLEQRYQQFNRGFVSGELEQCLNSDPASVKS